MAVKELKQRKAKTMTQPEFNQGYKLMSQEQHLRVGTIFPASAGEKEENIRQLLSLVFNSSYPKEIAIRLTSVETEEFNELIISKKDVIDFVEFFKTILPHMKHK